MPETKSDKFKRLKNARLPKAVHSIELLGNLSGPNYEWSKQEAQELVDTLQAAVDDIAAEYGVTKPRTEQEVVKGNTTPANAGVHQHDDVVDDTFIADGGSTAISEIRWAYDAARRGDNKLAANRLERILKLKD